ncbi:ANTAR domain-containing protein [Streptomyces violaceorubidus]
MMDLPCLTMACRYSSQSGCSPEMLRKYSTSGSTASDLRQSRPVRGPCRGRRRDGSALYSSDLATEDRWPAYTEYALGTGVRCVLALPLAVEGETGAALNLYGIEPDSLAQGLDAARTFAERAADAVNEALRIERQHASAADVRTALLSRSVIDQAVGMLMARERIDAHRALERLRRASQERNVKLRDLCAQVVARASGGASHRGT